MNWLLVVGKIPVVVLPVHESNELVEAPRSGQHLRGVVTEIPLSDGVVLVANEISEYFG